MSSALTFYFKDIYPTFEEFKQFLIKENVVGKKLDFLIQEMNRETNTIGSKSSSIEITNLVVEIKTQIEDIREQIQNIE